MTLVLDPKHRIKPEDAICHDFITGRYFIHCDGRHEYIKMTNDSFLGAFGVPLVGMHYIPTRNAEVTVSSHNPVQQRTDFTNTSTLVSSITQHIPPYNVFCNCSTMDHGASWTNENDVCGYLQRKQALPIHYALFPGGDISSHELKWESVPNPDKIGQVRVRNNANDGKKNSSKISITCSSLSTGEITETSASTSKAKNDAWPSGSQVKKASVAQLTTNLRGSG